MSQRMTIGKVCTSSRIPEKPRRRVKKGSALRRDDVFRAMDWRARLAAMTAKNLFGESGT